MNSHHLLEKQFAKKFGISNTDDIIAVGLTPLWHKGVKAEKLLGIGNNLDNIINNELARISGKSYKVAKQTATAEQIWKAHRNIYEKIGEKDWAKAIYNAYVKKLGIKY